MNEDEETSGHQVVDELIEWLDGDEAPFDLGPDAEEYLAATLDAVDPDQIPEILSALLLFAAMLSTQMDSPGAGGRLVEILESRFGQDAKEAEKKKAQQRFTELTGAADAAPKAPPLEKRVQTHGVVSAASLMQGRTARR